VQSVEAGGPAEKAARRARRRDHEGRRPHCGNVGRVAAHRRQHQAGTKATLQVFRRGSNRDLSVVVAEYEPERVVACSRRARQRQPPTVSSIGVAVSDLTDAEA
jgi:serine protease Do